MTSTLRVTATTLSNKQMNVAIQSYAGSLTYMKLLIPLGITNIVHNRINYAPESFNNHLMSDVPYKSISNKIKKNHRLHELYFWMKNAMQSLSNKYLKELFIIIRKKDTKEVLEHYRFVIKYDPDDDKVLPTGQAVVDATANFFKEINDLSENEKFDSDDISLAMQVTLNDDAPKDYVTPTFEQSHEGYLDIKNNSNYCTLHVINSGYHKLKVLAKGKIFEINNDSAAAEEEMETSSVHEETNSQEYVSVGNNNEDLLKTVHYSANNDNAPSDNMSVLNLSEMSEDNNMQCICKISKSFDKIEEIVCTACEQKLHTPCIGFKTREHVPEPYMCYNCCSNKGLRTKDFRMSNIKEDKNRTVLAQFRLAMLYGFLNSSPAPVLNHVSHENHVKVIHKMKRSNIITCIKDQIVINKDIAESKALNTLFYTEVDSTRLETMVIEGEEDSEEVIRPTKKMRVINV